MNCVWSWSLNYVAIHLLCSKKLGWCNLPINPSLLTQYGNCSETFPKSGPTGEKCSMFSVGDHLFIEFHGIGVLPIEAYAHNTSHMCEDGTAMHLLYLVATKLDHQQRIWPTKGEHADVLQQQFTSQVTCDCRQRRNNSWPPEKTSKDSTTYWAHNWAGWCCFLANEDADLMIVKKHYRAHRTSTPVLWTWTLLCLLNGRA